MLLMRRWCASCHRHVSLWLLRVATTGDVVPSVGLPHLNVRGMFVAGCQAGAVQAAEEALVQQGTEAIRDRDVVLAERDRQLVRTLCDRVPCVRRAVQMVLIAAIPRSPQKPRPASPAVRHCACALLCVWQAAVTQKVHQGLASFRDLEAALRAHRETVQEVRANRDRLQMIIQEVLADRDRLQVRGLGCRWGVWTFHVLTGTIALRASCGQRDGHVVVRNFAGVRVCGVQAKLAVVTAEQKVLLVRVVCKILRLCYIVCACEKGVYRHTFSILYPLP
jgi:hypothetical protein